MYRGLKLQSEIPLLPRAVPIDTDSTLDSQSFIILMCPFGTSFGIPWTSDSSRLAPLGGDKPVSDFLRKAILHREALAEATRTAKEALRDPMMTQTQPALPEPKTGHMYMCLHCPHQS
jgi:hypothetical protein